MAETIISETPECWVIRNESAAGFTIEYRAKPGSQMEQVNLRLARLKAMTALTTWATDASNATSAWDGWTQTQKNAATKTVVDRLGKLCTGLADLLDDLGKR